MAYEHRELDPALRALTLEIAAEARAEWGFASDIIARSFRAHRELSSGGRRRVAEAVYGLIRMDRRLDAIVDSLPGLGDELSPVLRDELKLMMLDLREGMPSEAAESELERLGLGKGSRLGARIDLSGVADEDAGLGARSGLEREAVRLSYPTWLVERLTNDLGATEGLAACEAMNQRAPMALRVNTVKITREALIDRLAEENVVARPTALAPAGLILETRVNAFGLSAFRDGLFEVMDEGSQIVAELVGPAARRPRRRRLRGRGRQDAGDRGGHGRQGPLAGARHRRAQARGAAAARAPRRPVQCHRTRGDRRGAELPDEARVGGWDRVLVDAPCSGIGTLRRNPEARWRLTPQAIAGFPVAAARVAGDLRAACARSAGGSSTRPARSSRRRTRRSSSASWPSAPTSCACRSRRSGDASSARRSATD